MSKAMGGAFSIKKMFAGTATHLSLMASPNVLMVLLLLVATEVCALGVIYSTYRNRVLFSDLEVLRDEAEDMQGTWTQLLLEQSTLASFQRVVTEAEQKFNMRVPDPHAVVVLQQPR